MRRLRFVAAAFAALLSTMVLAQQSPSFLSPLRNARYVYVTSYDGAQFSHNLFPQDRQAISAVQESLQKSGHYTIVYRPEEADMIVAVESRPSEDILAVYDPQSWPTGTYLWRATAKGGLSSPSVSLVQRLEAALGKSDSRTPA